MKLPWNIVTHLIRHMRKMREFVTGDFSHLDEAGRRRTTADVRRMSCSAAAAIAPMPIPFADIWTITPVQMLMVRAIGNIYGYKLDRKALKPLLSTGGGGWLGQQVCLALFKVGMPGAGGLGGAVFVYVWTKALAHAAEAYFASGMKASKTELREVLKGAMADTKDLPEPGSQT